MDACFALPFHHPGSGGFALAHKFVFVDWLAAGAVRVKFNEFCRSGQTSGMSRQNSLL